MTLNFQHLNTGNLLHVQRSVSPWLGKLKGKTKGRPDVNASSLLDPCVPLPIGVAGWSSVKLWLHATPKGGGKLSVGESASQFDIPLFDSLLKLTFPTPTRADVMQMVTHCNYRWGLLSQSIGREPRCGNGWLGDLQYNPVECRRLEYGAIKWSSSFIILSRLFGNFVFGAWLVVKMVNILYWK